MVTETARVGFPLADERGWAIVSGAIEEIAREYSANQVSRRSAGRNSSRLKQVPSLSREDARARTLSALSGLDAQPLHTDGAHLRLPPKYLLLQAARPSLTSTRVMAFRDAEWGELAQRSIFSVNNGGRTFYRAALGEAGLQFDPGCMRASNDEARRLVDEIESASAHAHEVSWPVEDQVLVVANRVALHGRAGVEPGDEDRLMKRVALY